MTILSKTLKVKSVLALLGKLACSMNCGTVLTLRNSNMNATQRCAAEARQQKGCRMLAKFSEEETEKSRQIYVHKHDFAFQGPGLNEGNSVTHVMPTMVEDRLAQKQHTAAARIRESAGKKEAAFASSLRQGFQVETLFENVARLEEIKEARVMKRWEFVENEILKATWGGLIDVDMQEQQIEHTKWKPFQLLFKGTSMQNGLKKPRKVVQGQTSASAIAKEFAPNLSFSDFRKMKDLAYLVGPGHFQNVIIPNFTIGTKYYHQQKSLSGTKKQTKITRFDQPGRNKADA